MKILALDTSTELCSVALSIDGGMLSHAEMAGNRHSELLLPMVDELLADAGWRLDELDGLAFGRGPGSFTGLRIGCGVAQGLAFGANLPVVGVVTLAAMAEEVHQDMALGDHPTHVLACIDARMHEIYAAAYRCTAAGIEEIMAPAVLRPEALVLPEGGDWIGCGNGFSTYPDLLKGQLTEIRADIHPHARSIARLALPRFEAGETGPAESAEPLYIRDKVALKTCERQ
ncbi:MAG: tRNA (adenosine(37)-N6)-threonylcarbamoyltransferase complex dimerization subunit type 1 TsaB [Gallionellaceae bacterium]|nr:tRNA (adenosine(37)-N6)-threonylcarbamoyltransferase complex dimerization subunit type 1 TsaB [Gallionellaceae bacterium]MDD5364913.1 tRNA (adenosine(37)-N6)-threonylcarbamoyltransferase complex dimerization subunit type 1 TsaB [Gallionellaceae bacterium]